MAEKIPKTNKECYALLDEMLSEEEKQAVVEMDEAELHFTLGLWIRNNWLYPQSQEDTEELMKTFSKKPLFYYHPDDYSSIILTAYKKHLKQKMKRSMQVTR